MHYKYLHYIAMKSNNDLRKEQLVYYQLCSCFTSQCKLVANIIVQLSVTRLTYLSEIGFKLSFIRLCYINYGIIL